MHLISMIDTSPRLKMLRDRAQAKAEQSGAAARDWYQVRAADDDTTEISIYDEISWFGVTASAFANDLRAITTRNINLRLSSPGGDVFDGIAIHNAIRSHPARVTVQVDGIAASIASVIAMAGDEIVMGPHSQLMVHDARGMVYGDPADVREFLDLLERQSDNISQVYRERAGGQARSWRAKMTAETWFTADEAVSAGLADRVAKYPRQAAEETTAQAVPKIWDLSVFRYAGREQAPAPDSAPEPQATAAEPEKATAAQIIVNVTGASGLEAIATLMRQVQEEHAELEAMAADPQPDDDGQAAAADSPQATAEPDQTTTRLTFGRRTANPAAARTLAFGRGGPSQ